MANDSVAHLISLINQSTKLQEDLSIYLHKAGAMAQVALGEGILDCSESISHHYWWALSDILERAKRINEKSLDILLKQKPLLTQ